MNKNITWKELKALDDLYHLKKTKANIQDHPYIKYLLEEKCILDKKPDNIKVITSTDDFIEFYEEIQEIRKSFFTKLNNILFSPFHIRKHNVFNRWSFYKNILHTFHNNRSLFCNSRKIKCTFFCAKKHLSCI